MSTYEGLAIRILIVDNQALVRAGLRVLIERQKNMVVVGEASGCDEAVAIADREQPDIILLDLGAENGTDCLGELIENAPGSRVLIITGIDDKDTHHRAIHLGAMGIVFKSQPVKVLIKAIEKVHAGEAWLDRATTARILIERREQRTADGIEPEAIKIAALTEREREVIALVCQGFKTKQIAERLFISEKTVSNHLRSIYDKLEVSDRLELALYAYRQRIVRPISLEPSNIGSP